MESSSVQPSFEDALTRLEAIVESMEAGDVPLADLIARFEQGTQLLKVGEGRLQEAVLRIEQLRRQKDGALTTERFEPAREA